MKKTEIKCYALAVLVDELFMDIAENGGEKTKKLTSCKGFVGIHQDIRSGANYFLFISQTLRNAAFNQFHEQLETMLVVYPPCFVDVKYLQNSNESKTGGMNMCD